MASVYGWLLNFLILITLLGIICYQLMSLTDLELDYTNPYDSASSINMVVLPEYITQGVLCMAFLSKGHWFMCLLSLPMLYYNVRLYMRRQHLVDVTEICNQNQLNWEKKQRLYKLGYLVILLIMYLFWLLWTIGDDVD